MTSLIIYLLMNRHGKEEGKEIFEAKGYEEEDHEAQGCKTPTLVSEKSFPTLRRKGFFITLE